MKYSWYILVAIITFLACFAIDRWILGDSKSKDETNSYLSHVHRSLHSSNSFLLNNSSQMLESMNNHINNPASAPGARVWLTKAEMAARLAGNAYNYVEKDRNLLLTEAAKHSFPATSNRSAEKIFIKQKQGEKLYAELNDYIKNLLAIDPAIHSAFSHNNLPIQKDINSSDKKTIEKWVGENFDDKTTLEAEIVLDRIQNDVLLSEIMIINSLNNKIPE